MAMAERTQSKVVLALSGFVLSTIFFSYLKKDRR
jgi:hypothetical protein